MPESITENKPHPLYASFYLRGEELDPEKITEMLGLNPRKSFKRGDKRKNNKEWPHGLWMVDSSEQIESTDPIMHIQWLLEKLEPVRGTLVEISKDKAIDAEISCFWIMPSSHETLTILPELLNRIAALNIRLELSIYSP